MLKWAVLLVLVGVTLGDIQRIENVTDSCGIGDLKMCGFRDCNRVYARRESEKEFIDLKHIHGSQSATHNVQLTLYIQGAGDSHIVLSPDGQLDREERAVYDFVIGGWNNSRTIIRKHKRLVIFQSTLNVLSPDEPIEFQIEISSHGDISIYREGHIIVRAFDQNPLDVNYVSLGGLDKQGIYYYYNCRPSTEVKGDMIARAGMGAYSGSDVRLPTNFLLVMHAIFCSILLWWTI